VGVARGLRETDRIGLEQPLQGRQTFVVARDKRLAGEEVRDGGAPRASRCGCCPLAQLSHGPAVADVEQQLRRASVTKRLQDGASMRVKSLAS